MSDNWSVSHNLCKLKIGAKQQKFSGGKSADMVGLPLLALYRKGSNCQANRACQQKIFPVGNRSYPSPGDGPSIFL